jgi:hypothetical protein
VDGHSAFNGGVDGSRPSGGTKKSTSHCNQSVGVSKYSERRLNPESNCWFYLPRWRNGSVFVLHAKGDSSILSQGTIGVRTTL